LRRSAEAVSFSVFRSSWLICTSFSTRAWNQTINRTIRIKAVTTKRFPAHDELGTCRINHRKNDQLKQQSINQKINQSMNWAISPSIKQAINESLISQ